MVSSPRTAAPGEAEQEGPVPDAAGQPHTPGRPRRHLPRSGQGRMLPLSLAVLLVPASVGLIRLLIGLHRPMALYGDAAILETAVRRVATGTQMVGPYSRFGFHQPGPAYFFVQAPFSWATGGSSRAMFLGALAINAGAAIGSVLVVRRVLGESAARWAAAVTAAYMVLLKPEL